jgi:hypothetical protein
MRWRLRIDVSKGDDIDAAINHRADFNSAISEGELLMA